MNIKNIKAWLDENNMVNVEVADIDDHKAIGVAGVPLLNATEKIGIDDHSERVLSVIEQAVITAFGHLRREQKGICILDKILEQISAYSANAGIMPIYAYLGRKQISLLSMQGWNGHSVVCGVHILRVEEDDHLKCAF